LVQVFKHYHFDTTGFIKGGSFLSIMTDIGRWDEWRELMQEYAFLDEDSGLMVVDCAMNDEWDSRYPDEVWACYVRPARESGVKPVGVTPMFVVIMDPRERFTPEKIVELHQGSLAEMRAEQKAQAQTNIALKHNS
jgi:hypothetical protein